MNGASEKAERAASMETAFIALGSNVGDRLAHLAFAAAELRNRPGIVVRGVSPVYESPAHTLEHGTTAPDFLNAVVQLETDLSAEQLLEVLHQIERAAGRVRNEDGRWAPRTLDLDLLIFDQATIRSEELTVPHPRLGIRRFVLSPLADLAPHRHVPAPYDRTVTELLDACPDRDRPTRTPFTL